MIGHWKAALGFTALLALSACKTTTAVADTSPAAPVDPPLAISHIAATDFRLVSFSLETTGKLGPGVTGSEMIWTAKDDQGQIGAGTVPLTVAADRTFTVGLPVTIAKTLSDLTPYQNTDEIEVTIEASVGGATTTQTVNLRSPHIPTPKVLTVQGTLSSPTTIDMTFLFALLNSNLYPLHLVSVDYKAYLADKVLVDTQLPMAGSLKQSEQTEFTLPAEANPDNCGKGFKEMAKAKSLPWRFSGTMHFETLDVPFDLTGTLALSRSE